ncbi:peptidoglycan-binding protein [Paracoccus sp. M683]|uniref:peptidoglycan-binding protein n=1 Tax=Paracoccus sp. M683 TaxID=2594268 RepID=UPI00163D7DDF|nr:peptidoglycan-binding protein [Paracoccus sp. M683]
MRRFHWMLMAAWLPGAALAQAQDAQVVIRIEAKRGEAATAQAAEGWRNQFEDVVTFPLARGWTGIGLGPMPADQAAARLEQLKAEGKVPADSFVAPQEADMVLTTVAAPDPAAATAAAATDAAEIPADAAGQAVTDTPEPSAESATDTDQTPAVTPPPAAAVPGSYMRFESFQDRAAADAALETLRQNIPDAGMWELPSGRFAIGLGPLAEDVAAAWLVAFKAAELVPGDAFLASDAEIGIPVGDGAAAAAAPDLPAPPAEPAELPPLDQVQRALRWAGYYDGTIDGKSGPQTRAAINAEIAAERLSPDAGTAMARLIERRAAWRDEMGLSQLDDAYTGLSAVVPMDRLAFDRNERVLSIYGPRDGSGAALILFSQPGGQQELIDLSGLVIALGWVPQPRREVQPGAITLHGRNATHIGHAEGRVRDGRAEGFVLIWPIGDEANQGRVAAELSDSFTRFAPAENDPRPASTSTGAGSAIGAPQVVTDPVQPPAD